MKDRSREQLVRSIEKRIKHLMIKTLEDFETFFPQIDDTEQGQIFKAQIRTSFNDVIRAQRDELNDYSVDYRPLRKNADNSISITRTFLETIQKVEFGDKPFFCIFADQAHFKILTAIREELGVGVIYKENNSVILEIAGLLDCVAILPVIDNYVLHKNVREKYHNWRQEIIKKYRS